RRGIAGILGAAGGKRFCLYRPRCRAFGARLAVIAGLGDRSRHLRLRLVPGEAPAARPQIQRPGDWQMTTAVAIAALALFVIAFRLARIVPVASGALVHAQGAL